MTAHSITKLNENESEENAATETFCGYVAIVGRPNVGKSTLLNKIIGQKISITSRKPQTTRHKILGIKTEGTSQIIYVDTPGLHLTEKVGKESKRALDRYMKKAAYQAIAEVDVVLFVVEGTNWRKEDEWIFNKVSKLKCPVILVINKVDQIKPKEKLLPYLELLSKKMDFVTIVPVSARRGMNVADLEKEILKLLPKSPFFYFAEQITDKANEFRIAEIIREKLIKLLGQELPYATSVMIDKMNEEKDAAGKNILHINATIFVEREGQKAIIIGKKGEKLKQIGTSARKEIEKTFSQKVFLELWVKVKEKWTDDQRMLKVFGYR